MSTFLQIAPYTGILSHFRFLLTLRSEEGKYHSLILFRLSSGPRQYASEGQPGFEDTKEPDLVNPDYDQLYAMEASCPHLGADLSHVEIEECEDSVIAVCPWHRYDFDLETGESNTGLKACTYKVQARKDDSDGKDKVWLEVPDYGTNWKLVELRPVSEEFADPPPAADPATLLTSSGNLDDSNAVHLQQVMIENQPLVPLENPPKTLLQWAVLILNTSNPTLKVQRTRHAVQLFRTAQLTSIGHKAASAPEPPPVPPRDDDWASNVARKGHVKSKQNRASTLHALANIEQWAIDLAWDIMARFGPMHRELPPAFFSDFSKMALDESKHFTLLTKRLLAVSPDTPYGSLPVHAGLWDSATSSSHSLLSRLAIIHLVHEARGLDVNPRTIDRFRKSGDIETVKVMETIHNDEVTHVTTGHRWFTWMCEREGDRKSVV